MFRRGDGSDGNHCSNPWHCFLYLILTDLGMWCVVVEIHQQGWLAWPIKGTKNIRFWGETVGTVTGHFGDTVSRSESIGIPDGRPGGE